MRARPLVIPVAMLLAGCGSGKGVTIVGGSPLTPPPAASQSSAAASLTSSCAPRQGPASITGWVAYSLTLHNPGGSPVQVAWVAVIFSDASGQEIGSDDPAQQDYPGVAVPVTSFTKSIIGAGQSITVPMETNAISAATSNWSCALGEWSSQ